MISPNACIAIPWIAWLIGWGVGARWSAPAVVRQSASAQFAYTVPIWAGVVLIAIHPRRVPLLREAFLPVPVVIAWGGAVLVALGLAFTVWARVHLGRLWSADVTIKQGHTVVRTGPYGLTRHPIYTGLLVALVGTAVTRDTIAALVGVLLVASGLVIKIRQEERLLLEHLGAAYRAYQGQVPALIPRLSRRSR